MSYDVIYLTFHLICILFYFYVTLVTYTVNSDILLFSHSVTIFREVCDWPKMTHSCTESVRVVTERTFDSLTESQFINIIKYTIRNQESAQLLTGASY